MDYVIEHDKDKRLITVTAMGKWELEKVGKGKTKVTYTISSLPLNQPRFITDRIVHNSLMSTINKLILVAEK